MGFLNLFSKPEEPGLVHLPKGSFTVDSTGRILTRTLPQSFPEAHAQEIARVVLTVFKSAKEVNLPLKEIFIHFAGLKLTAKELRGGAMIFLAPLVVK